MGEHRRRRSPNWKPKGVKSPKLSCRRKLMYDTPEQAMAALNRARRLPLTRDKNDLNTYACQFCGKYHLGHKKKAPR